VLFGEKKQNQTVPEKTLFLESKKWNDLKSPFNLLTGYSIIKIR